MNDKSSEIARASESTFSDIKPVMDLLYLKVYYLNNRLIFCDFTNNVLHRMDIYDINEIRTFSVTKDNQFKFGCNLHVYLKKNKYNGEGEMHKIYVMKHEDANVGLFSLLRIMTMCESVNPKNVSCMERIANTLDNFVENVSLSVGSAEYNNVKNDFETNVKKE